MCNYKTNGLELAKEQFFEDLKADEDFIKFKERAKTEWGMSYGTVVVGVNQYLLNVHGPTSQTLISQFKKLVKDF